MSSPSLDNPAQQAEHLGDGRRCVAKASVVAGGLTVLLNVGLVLAAAGANNWARLAIAFVAGPVVNLIMTLASLGLIPLIRRRSGYATLTPFVLTITLIPVLGAVVVFLCVMQIMEQNPDAPRPGSW